MGRVAVGEGGGVGSGDVMGSETRDEIRVGVGGTRGVPHSKK